MKKKKKPEIRFEGFTDDWEQRKLEDEAIEMLAGGDIDKSRVVESGKYPIYANALTNDSIVGYYDDYYRVKAPAVTVTGRGDVGHAQARTVDFTPVVRLLAIRSEHDAYFLENAINNHGVIVESTGVPQLTVPQLGNYMIQFPKTIEEETKIGEYFDNLDHLITLHQRKYEKLKNLKKSMLKKMFPQKGCKVPGIRFSGFTDDWEQRKLLLICDFEKGRGLSKDNIDNNGKYPCILYGQLFTDYGMFINTVYSKSNIISEECKLSEKGDILIPRCDTTPDGLGRASVLALDNVILGFDINILKIKNKQKYDSGFVSVALNHHKKDLLSKVVGSTVRHLENKELRDVSIEYPNSLEEQKKVGEYFQALDHLITLHQRELEKLKNIKKTLLEKMF
ncbi:restriction endonuclease subunit S [Blautia intestinalis]|uniref:restriction endonuclease subunit S n=1 Tax=Blautia intestinalis TaxID=2763028 RepID=UPI0022E4B8F8|nr:restriction endonuclease subunit S [Blautia intestinalis]